MNDGLKPAWREEIRGVLSRFPKVKRAALFGSRATGCCRVGSDIDICLEGDDLTLKDQLSITSAMVELDLPVEVELVRWSAITNAALLDRIQKQGIVIYESEMPERNKDDGNI